MLTSWQRWFPDCEPISYHFRKAFRKRWVRFHSLPGSKRYPENEAEVAIVLERHNRILGELAGHGEKVVLLTTGYSETPEPQRYYDELLQLDPFAIPWRAVAMHEIENDLAHPRFWHVFVSEWAWTPGTFDPLVRLIADDVIANVMIVALDGKWLLHPYDGGMDVVLETREARGRLTSRFREWLSARSDGL